MRRAIAAFGLAAWLAASLSVTAAAAEDALPRVSPQLVHQRQVAADATLLVVDVRTPDEYASGHVPGAINLPHDQVAARLAELPKDKDLVLYCRSGRRVALAAATLGANGYHRIAQLDGDMPAWLAQGLPVETPGKPD